jgi:hypothetical protein
MRGAILPLPQYAFMAWCSVKNTAQEQLNLYLTLPRATPSNDKAVAESAKNTRHHLRHLQTVFCINETNLYNVHFLPASKGSQFLMHVSVTVIVFNNDKCVSTILRKDGLFFHVSYSIDRNSSFYRLLVLEAPRIA